jgi:hypothetical protein
MKPWMSLALAGLCVGCDAQAGEQYGGEPLLTMTGSVKFALDVPNEQDLVPMIAFRSLDSGMYMINVEAEGQFPAEFTLNVYDTPPEEALVRGEADSSGEQPRVAMGHVIAAAPDAPLVWHDGDELPGDVQDTYAGFSENYLIIWLEEALPPNSWTAYQVGQRDEGLAQGYHLIKITEREEPPDYFVCIDEALAIAASRTNDEYGTSYTAYDIEQLCYDQAPEDCDDGELFTAYRDAFQVAEIELNCGPNTRVFERIADPASAPLSIRIGPSPKSL